MLNWYRYFHFNIFEYERNCGFKYFTDNFCLFNSFNANAEISLCVFQSNSVGGSAYMEKEGLKCSMEKLKEKGLKVATIVTDRHPQIQKWVRETMRKEIHPGAVHFYDPWHICKGTNLVMLCFNWTINPLQLFNWYIVLYFKLLFPGFKAKMLKLAAQKDCNILHEWIKSIINHMYWCAASTPNGDGDIIKAKWVSVMAHIMDIHEHEDPKFPKCLHPPITEDEGKKKWLKPSKHSILHYYKSQILNQDRAILYN